MVIDSTPGTAPARRDRPPQRPTLLWYGGFPLGFHNPESERKASEFAARGYEVVYSTGVGLRDPRPRSAAKVLEIARHRWRGAPTPTATTMTSTGFVVLPPRRAPIIRQVNRRLMVAQLQRAVPRLADGVAWVRYPSPELVDALAMIRPRVVVYECLDAMEHTPGTAGAWQARFLDAERRLASMADALIVPSEALGSRFDTWRSKVHVVGHGVELSGWRPAPRARVAGFVGTLDYRLDLDVIEAVAALSGWTVRLVGPVSEGLDVDRLRGIAGVSLHPPVAYAEVADLLASFDVGLMPYVDSPFFRGMTPIKNIELLAVGRPAVARRSPALEEFSNLVTFADSPEEFAASVERVSDEDNETLARRRLAVAALHSSDVQIDRLVGIADGLLGREG